MYLCTTVITHLDFHLARLHISSLSWLLLFCRSNISLIIRICFNVNIFSLEHGHPEVYTELKREGLSGLLHLPFPEEMWVAGTSQDTLWGTFGKSLSCLQVIRVINCYVPICLLLCYFQLVNYKVIEILHSSILKAIFCFL